MTIPHFKVIIPAAGTGSRMNQTIPKQYLKIGGKTVLRHTLEVFSYMRECTEIYVAIGADDADWFQRSARGIDICRAITGGKTRKESVYNALKNIQDPKDEDIILIHDAARPYVHPDNIHTLLDTMCEERAATLALPITATLRKAKENDYTGDTIDRTSLWEIQTPQAFHYKDLLRAHETFKDKEATDDSALVSMLGIPVKLVPGSHENIKITMPQDIQTARKYLQHKTETRIGQGFDVHAFDNNKAGPVRLCGIDVAHTHALKGHSDADVGLHTLTDAIYGAIGEGDIGIHFPPSDDTFKNMDSAVFLKHALDMMRNKGARMINADITLICEHPKIGPHAQAMKERIAKICDIAPARINIKATTTEKLGFTGRGEGIAAQAVVSILFPAESDPDAG